VLPAFIVIALMTAAQRISEADKLVPHPTPLQPRKQQSSNSPP
jgi:hypothetical protein